MQISVQGEDTSQTLLRTLLNNLMTTYTCGYLLSGPSMYSKTSPLGYKVQPLLLKLKPFFICSLNIDKNQQNARYPYTECTYFSLFHKLTEWFHSVLNSRHCYPICHFTTSDSVVADSTSIGYGQLRTIDGVLIRASKRTTTVHPDEL